MIDAEESYQRLKQDLGINDIDAELTAQNRSLGQQTGQQGNWFEHITNLLIPSLLSLELSPPSSSSSSSSSFSSSSGGSLLARDKQYDPKRIKVLHRVTFGMGAAEFDLLIVYVKETVDGSESEPPFDVPGGSEKNLLSSLTSAINTHRKMSHPLLSRLLDRTIHPCRDQQQRKPKQHKEGSGSGGGQRKLPEIARYLDVEEVISIVECKSNSRDISGSFSALQETLRWLSSPDNTGYEVSRWKNNIFRSGHFDSFGYHIEASTPLTLYRFQKTSFSRFSPSPSSLSIIQDHLHYVTRKSQIDVPFSVGLSVALYAVKHFDCDPISEENINQLYNWCRETQKGVSDSFSVSSLASNTLVWQITPLFAFDFVLFCLLTNYHLKQPRLSLSSPDLSK